MSILIQEMICDVDRRNQLAQQELNRLRSEAISLRAGSHLAIRMRARRSMGGTLIRFGVLLCGRPNAAPVGVLQTVR
jgi:hypothetical protein